MAKQNDIQEITKAKGRPMLTWVGKHPLERVEWYPAQEKEVYGDKSVKEFSKLFWGDNLQVLSHLLKEYRGKVDLIYIDPPFDSKADYIKKVKIRGEQIDGVQESILEEKQYTDIWENDEYLQFIYERLLILKELLSDTGSIYLHCDYHKSAYLRLMLDEVIGEENFRNEIVWKRTFGRSDAATFGATHDSILFYTKTDHFQFQQQFIEYTDEYKTRFNKKDKKGMYMDRNLSASGLSGGGYHYQWKGVDGYWRCPISTMEKYEKEDLLYYTTSGVARMKQYLHESNGTPLVDIWTDVNVVNSQSEERGDYPTQKPEVLLERIIRSSSNEGNLVLDCFCGSGTTMAVAQKLGRKWIGCDINIGAIQTTTKRLAQIIEDQQKANHKLIKDDFNGLLAFKIYNVNEYDIFKNEVEAKEIVMEIYGVEQIKRSSFDGTLDNNFVKVMSLNRVLNKLDVTLVLKNIADNIDNFTTKTISKADEAIYEEGVIVICSGAELDVEDFLKKENKTGVKVTIRDILNDKKNLIFKKKPEARIEVNVKDKKLSVVIKEFYSPILMRKLELENEKSIDKKAQAKVEDFKQIIDSIAIDVNYDGKLFNAEIIDLPNKKEHAKVNYSYTYTQGGKYTVAVKIVDVLGEEYFETFNVET